ncbi:MAG: hypothetical protein U1F36_19025 [Planctomycetota bacterium]
MLFRFQAAGLAAVLAAGSLGAQIAVDRGRIIGLAADPSGPAITPPTVQHQILCRPASRVCQGIGDPVADFAGGLAYNGAHASVWQTQGTRMQETALDGCTVLCAVPAALTLGPGSLASGLALSESTSTLYQLESDFGAAALHQWALQHCPPQVIASCRFALPTPRHHASGVAVDRRGGWIYYATAVFGPSPTGPQNQILVAQLSDPCNILCGFPVLACSAATPMGPLTGLAFDDCDSLLYATDGTNVVTLQRSSLQPCAYQTVACCTVGPSGSQAWYGIDIEAVHAFQVGQSCLGGNCPNCGNMRLGAHGDPNIGNPDFAISIDDGPAGGRAFLGFNVGRCVSQSLPFLCGPFYPDIGALPPVFIGLGPLTGVGCSGSVISHIPVPLDYSLCGGALCFQGLVICPSAAIPSVALTNALQIVIDA